MQGRMMHMELTVGSLVEHAVRFHAKTEVISVETDGSVSRCGWEDIGNNSRRLAAALDGLGVQREARCGTIAWNNRRHLEIYFGVPGGGRITHTINPRLTPEQIVFIIGDAQAEVLFFDKTFLPLVAAIQSHLKTVKHFVLMGPVDPVAQDQVPGLLFYDELLEPQTPKPFRVSVNEQDAAALCYTSGTTGNPKGVLYSHRALVLHTLAGNQPDGVNISARDSVLPVVPMFHVNAWGVPYMAAAVGAKLVLPGPKLDGQSLFDLMSAEDVSLALGVPTIWIGLLAAMKSAGHAPKSLTRTIVGGSAAPPSMIAAFRDLYDVDLIHAWGMTETAPLGTLNQPLLKHQSLPTEAQATLRHGQGRPPFGVDLRVVDEKTYAMPWDGVAQGHLQIRGHWIAESYLGTDADALTDDGWFETGDIATLDEDGFMIIRDRAKDIVKSGGEWISTVEVENIAVAHPDVANAACIGVPDAKWGERPVLLVQSESEGPDLERDLFDTLAATLAKWQVPDKIIFVDELPIGATGKVLKADLRKKFGNVLSPEVSA